MPFFWKNGNFLIKYIINILGIYWLITYYEINVDELNNCVKWININENFNNVYIYGLVYIYKNEKNETYLVLYNYVD